MSSLRAKLPKRGKKYWLIAGLLIVAGVGGWMLLREDKTAESAAVRRVPVESGSIEEVVTAQGKLEPKEYVDVGAQVSGQLKKIHVEIGDVVKAGALLAEIDPKVYESRVQADKARLRNLQAQLNEQQAQWAFARQQLARNERLIAVNAISKEALEDSSAAAKMAAARAESIQAQLEEAQSTLEGDQANLGFTKIFAPIGGTVVAQTAREGQTLNASQSAPTLVQLANLDIMTVRAQVAEADIPRLAPGLPVYFTILGAQDRRWEGSVRQILPSPQTVNDVVLYNVLVDVDNSDRQLMTGMSTQMFFVLGRAEQVLLLPVEGLGKRLPEQDNETGQAYQIRVFEGSKPQERTVHLGLMNRTQAEARQGVSLGEEIAVTARVKEKSGGGQGGRGGGGGRVPGPRL